MFNTGGGVSSVAARTRKRRTVTTDALPRTLAPALTSQRAWDPRSLLPLVILIVGGVAYANSFQGSFVLDDNLHLGKARITELSWDSIGGRRPLVDLTLALDHRRAAGDTLDPGPFHLTNLCVHLLAGLVLFGLVRRTLLTSYMPRRLRGVAPWLALVVATVWVVHPLQTQSVTYIIQRAESMMGLFYLLTLYAVVRGHDSRHSAIWYGGAIVACAMGMACKGVMVTAPLVVLLFDYAFLSRSPLEALRRRWWLYAGLASTWLVLVAVGVAGGVMSPSHRGGSTVGFSYKGISPLEYLLTQAGVLVHYLGLCLWPSPLVLDYGWPAARTAGQVVLPGLIVACALLGTLWALIRKPAIGFAAAWFLVILAPTSSVVPIKDPAFVHRLYLPLAGVVTLLVIGGYSVILAMARGGLAAVRRRVIVSFLAVAAVAALTGRTIARNRDFATDKGMWEEVVARRPEHGRAHLGWGRAIFEEGENARRAGDEALAAAKFATAEQAFRNAVRLTPGYGDAHYNLGNALSETGKPDEAVEAYRRAVAINPRHTRAHYNLANALKKLERYPEAIAAYRAAAALDPRHFKSRINLGNTLKLTGKLDEAVAAYHESLRINPNYANTHANLGDAYRKQGRLEEATVELEEALRLDPSHKTARRVLDRVMAELGG